MTAEGFRERVLAYKRAFDGAEEFAGRWWVRLASRTGIARFARYVLRDQLWLAIVLADLEHFCHDEGEQTTHVFSAEDPHGRDSAQLEGRRQVYRRIRRYLALTPAEERRRVDALLQDQGEVQKHAS